MLFVNRESGKILDGLEKQARKLARNQHNEVSANASRTLRQKLFLIYRIIKNTIVSLISYQMFYATISAVSLAISVCIILPSGIVYI